jgi:hypothetical protein
MDQASRNLVVVRCGDSSLHKNWCTGKRTWDLGVSYFGNRKDYFPEARYMHIRAAGKWDGIFDFFACNPETLSLYDYFWFPDDDIDASTDSVEELFQSVRRYDLELAQPSLGDQSYYSHLLTLCNSEFRIRYVNFVEIMVPVLSRDLLSKTLGRLRGTRTGFGLDFLWPRLTSNPYRKIAILDEITVTHTRPVGGELHRTASAVGERGDDELAREMKVAGISGRATINGISVPRVLVHAGIARDGRFLDGPRATALLQAQGLLKLRRHSRQHISLKSVARYTAKHLIG